MKKAIVFPFVVIVTMVISAAAACAQTPVPDPDTLSNPVQEGDPAVRHLPPRMDYVEDRQRITPEEVPDPVQQTLESSAQYSNWQKADIFRDKNKEEYVIEFKEAGKTTAYRFDKQGRPIIEEQSRH